MITVHDLHRVSPDAVGAWARHVAENLRDADREEVDASSGMSPQSAVAVSLMMSTQSYAILDRDEVPVALFGATPHPLPGVGVAWFLGTDGLLREAHSIARQSKDYMDRLSAEYPLLWNYVDERNAVSIRWLKWGGFTLHGTRYTDEGHAFRIFARTVHV